MAKLQSVFITGATGFIGGSVLAELINNHKEEYSITALVRSEAKAKAVATFGATPLVGSHEDPGVLENAAKTHDIIIHTADSADHLVSAKAIIAGLSARSESLPRAIYIHTSGTGVISDEARGLNASPFIHNDLHPKSIDGLDEKQPHRDVDIFVRDAAKTLGNKATVAIIIPPLIYGIGTGPGKKVTDQIPALIRFAIKNKFAPIVGQGQNIWNNVHVKDLARGYVYLLQYLKAAEESWTGYWFAETGEHQWEDVYKELGKVLFQKGLVESPIPKNPGINGEDGKVLRGGDDAYDCWGGNSRCRAERLRQLGWSKVESLNVLTSLPDEVDAVSAEKF
ncbi:NAD(P)-binding protein [Sistotremastrum niveocremeum HHB9708]|uniref:NAD(P)-binding protein n=1 Tax=Sistotremastrum niveocremeum HHB9708 TaxID=1314777 RepID=A0A165A301_9AGAM|nr:NAD(P)-binding protein [Sistotremastrum niveocremeum HHB9708]